MQRKYHFIHSCKLCLLFTILFSISVSELKSQDDFSVEGVQKRSDELYQSKKWNELIRYGNKALEKGIDFYTLRIKLGTAYYETQKYIYAIENLENAIESGFDDQNLLEKLYYSYLYTGRMEDADFTFTKLSESRKYKIRPLDNEFIENFNFEAGESISNDESKNGDFNLQLNSNQYGQQTLNKNSFLLNTGLSQMPVGRFSVYYGYAYQNLQKEKIIEYNNLKSAESYDQTQNHFYNRFDILIDNGFVVSPAGRFISTKENIPDVVIDSSSSSASSIMNRGSTEYTLTSSSTETIIENFILSLSVSKNISLFKLGINGSFSFLNEEHQSQIGALVSYFPFANRSFYSTSNFVLHDQNSVSNLIYTQLFGGMIRKGFYIEGYATFGKVYNYNEENGYIVFNNSDATTFKFGANLKYSVSKIIDLSLIYLNQQRERDYEVYNIPENNIQSSQTLYYSVNTILAGLKVNF